MKKAKKTSQQTRQAKAVPVAKEVTRKIKPKVERELWARAAGRCQFDGCNRIVYKSPLTQNRVNISEKAHIYSFSKNGPRGWGKLSERELNDIENLMLVCHDCHKDLDEDKGKRFPAHLLQRFKAEHEKRIFIVTGVDPSKKSHVILYGANIGKEESNLSPDTAKDALFPAWYPAEEYPVTLSMTWAGRDDNSSYWSTESENLTKIFEQNIRPMLARKECSHFSLFALAPMPLLTLLGSFLTDKVPVQTYQLHREPPFSWHWQTGPKNFQFLVKPPASFGNPPALVIALSDKIAHSRITDILGPNVSIWELTVAQPHNDFLKSKAQLAQFRETVRKLMVDIGHAHGKNTTLSIFPAMPVACAVELGRVRMPKADAQWSFYDHNNQAKKFIAALTIG
ncbi:MAG: hypothetical protein JWM16_5376 [Verrucomicrobiales bacterium]|nr:hypothetical protein [Verrucomicrobiales bacterium]